MVHDSAVAAHGEVVSSEGEAFSTEDGLTTSRGLMVPEPPFAGETIIVIGCL